MWRRKGIQHNQKPMNENAENILLAVVMIVSVM